MLSLPSDEMTKIQVVCWYKDFGTPGTYPSRKEKTKASSTKILLTQLLEMLRTLFALISHMLLIICIFLTSSVFRPIYI